MIYYIQKQLHKTLHNLLTLSFWPHFNVPFLTSRMVRPPSVLLNISSCVRTHKITKRDESERPIKRLIKSEETILRPQGGYRLVETIQYSGM